MNLKKRMLKMIKKDDGFKKIASVEQLIKEIRKENVLSVDFDFERSDRSVGMMSDSLGFVIVVRNENTEWLEEIKEKEEEMISSSKFKECIAELILEYKEESKEVENFVYDADIDDDGKVKHYSLTKEDLVSLMTIDEIEAIVEDGRLIVEVVGYCY